MQERKGRKQLVASADLVQRGAEAAKLGLQDKREIKDDDGRAAGGGWDATCHRCTAVACCSWLDCNEAL